MKKVIFATIVAVSVLFSIVASADVTDVIKEKADQAGTVLKEGAGKLEQTATTMAEGGKQTITFGMKFYDEMSVANFFFGHNHWSVVARFLTFIIILLLWKGEGLIRQGRNIFFITITWWPVSFFAEAAYRSAVDSPDTLVFVWAMVAAVITGIIGIYWMYGVIRTFRTSGATTAGIQMPVPPTPPPPAQPAATPQAAAAAVAQPAAPAVPQVCQVCGNPKAPGKFCKHCGAGDKKSRPRDVDLADWVLHGYRRPPR